MEEEILLEIEDHMENRIEAFRRDLGTVRTGRATTALLDNIRVSYFGTPTPLNQIATLSAPEANLLVVQPWDTKILGAIEKAVQQSDLGLNPSNDGRVIRLPVPPLTEERRMDLVKRVKHIAEECKVSLRAIRRDGNERLKKAEKASGLPEDASRRAQEKVQAVTERQIKHVDDLLARKSKEIMEI
ncbi:MAG: ribosome recycling factor [Candidatus Schekmanbacteria bacterium]|nr:ribosome recycling factor [Candidatus Schekmanbacteria bacterium]